MKCENLVNQSSQVWICWQFISHCFLQVEQHQTISSKRGLENKLNFSLIFDDIPPSFCPPPQFLLWFNIYISYFSCCFYSSLWLYDKFTYLDTLEKCLKSAKTNENEISRRAIRGILNLPTNWKISLNFTRATARLPNKLSERWTKHLY